MSKPVIQRDESIQHECLEKLCGIVRELSSQGKPIEMRTWLMAYTTDVVTCYSYGDPLGLLNDHEQAVLWREVIAALAFMTLIFRHFPLVARIGPQIPLAFLERMSKTISLTMGLHYEARRRARLVKNDFDRPVDSKASKGGRRPTVYHEILASNLPDEEKSVNRLSDEAFTIISTGGETTSRSLSVALYYVLATGGVLPKLRQELDKAIPDPTRVPPIKELERLPYLTAVIRETLRIGMNVLPRSPVISPEKPLQYGEWVIPPGTSISMTYSTVMMDERVFPDPWKFDPGRFLPKNPNTERNTRHLVVFGRGNRNCYGQNLAMSEMYLVIAGLFRRFELGLYETVFGRDIKVVRDCFLGETSLDSKDLRVTVISERR
ncbi:MAG: hypothetical protein M1820_007566 [Bogoriella megaspora]|nr:MAG: hypothetical protein M1820_007566 [Bogoriella megaspora]